MRGWQFIGNKCEAESYGEESHSLKLQSASVYIGHTGEGVVGHQLTYAQKKSKVVLVLAQTQMGKASTRTGFLVLMESFPLQTTTTSRKNELRSHSGLK